VVRFAAIDLGDDGQVIDVINGDKPRGQKPSRHLALMAGR
jgi:hypothetical protein